MDITSSELRDPRRYPSMGRGGGPVRASMGRGKEPIRVVQGPGEVIFVPSNWHHQVKNLEDTISINHNWTNAFGLQQMWSHLKSELQLVEKEIADCREMDGWNQQCQVILKATTGMDYLEFFQFLCLVGLPRLKQLSYPTSRTDHSAQTELTLRPSDFFMEDRTKPQLQSLSFSELEKWLVKALSCPSFDFFDLRNQPRTEQPNRREGSGAILHREHLCVEPVAQDEMASVLHGCVPEPSRACSVLSKLLAMLPEDTRSVLQQLVSSAGQNTLDTEQLLLVTLRAYELHCIWCTMSELVQSAEFTAVLPQLCT